MTGARHGRRRSGGFTLVELLVAMTLLGLIFVALFGGLRFGRRLLSSRLLGRGFLGRRRFDEFQRALSLSRSVLTQRLGRLVDEGLLEKRLYEERPPRHELRTAFAAALPHALD